jgi:hypothetical protein
MSEIRVFKCSLEDDEETKDMILRGVLDPATLKFIRLDWYQREQGFSKNHIDEIISGYILGNRVPDITIGMRGSRVKSSGDTYTLLDRCYCIDGGQRLAAASLAVKERPDIKINLGVKLYFNTNEEFENEMFCRLGTTQVRITPSVILRNRKKKSVAASQLLIVSKDDRFALKDRIAWDQVKTRHELMSGATLARIVGALHAHKGGALKSTKPYQLLGALDALVIKISDETLIINVIRFFDTIDKVWSIRQLTGARDEPRPHLNPKFLLTIASLMSRYSDFWDGKARNEFNCPDKFIRRLRGFKLTEYLKPRAIPKDALYEILRKRLNLDPTFEDPEDETTAEAAE